MAITIICFFIRGNILMGGFQIIALSISLIPVFVNRSFNINLPWPIDFWLTMWMFLAVLGETGFYDRFSWWDNLLHFGGTAVLVYLAFVLVFALNFTDKIRLSIPLIGFATFLVGVAFGAIWEVAEFWVWRITGSDALAMHGSYKNGLLDTFTDLQLDIVASALVALVGMKYVAKQRHVLLREWMYPFAKIFSNKTYRAKNLSSKFNLRRKK